MIRNLSLSRAAGALAISATALILSSCANFNTIGRTDDLPFSGRTIESVTVTSDNATTRTRTTEAAGKGLAIHLDAPQRLAYSNAIGQMCAEPSPDAIQAYASAIGASLIVPGKAADIAGALNAASGSIGLRTQAITLMRDSLYRICEAYYNKALTEMDVLQLLQRAQDLTLSVLAIEQLTGTVVARQVNLTPEAGASAARDMLNNRVDALERAKKNEADRKTALEKAKNTADTLRTKVNEDTELEKAAKAKAAPIEANIAKLDPQVKAETEKLKPLSTALTNAKTDQAKQKAKVDDIQKALDAATAKKDQAEIDKQTKLLEPEKTQLATLDAAVTKAQAPYDAQKAVLDPLQKQLNDAKDAPELKTANTAGEKLGTDTKAKVAADTALKEAETEYADAQKITESRRALLANGTSAVDAVAKVGGVFSPSADRNNIDKDTVAALSEATVAIVKAVVEKDHTGDVCGNLLSTTFSQRKDDQFKALVDYCGNRNQIDRAKYADWAKLAESIAKLQQAEIVERATAAPKKGAAASPASPPPPPAMSIRPLVIPPPPAPLR